MTGPVRTLIGGAQDTKDVLPANLFQFYVEEASDLVWEDIFDREDIPVHNGTPEGDVLMALNGRMTQMTYSAPIFFDQTARLWTAVAGLPTETPVVGDTTVIDHAYKRITVADPPLWAFQGWDNLTGNWRQMLNAVLDNVELTQDENKAPKIKYIFKGQASTAIADPTPPAIVSAYNPMGYRLLNGTIAAALANIMKYTLKLNNQRKERYYGQASANVGRYTRQRATTELDLTADILALSGSLKERYDNDQDFAGAVQFQYIDMGANIGTSHHPQMTIALPKARLKKVALQTINGERAQVVNAVAGYDNTAATGLTVTFRNLDAVGAYAGS